MTGGDPQDEGAILAHLRALAVAGAIPISDHANQMLAERGILIAEVREALSAPQLLENYPHYAKGPCCLVYGRTQVGRPIHLVCSTTLARLVIITVYEPQPPKWRTPTERG